MKKQGFTLVEVMITGMLMVALGAGILGLNYVLGQSQLTAIDSFIQVEESSSSIRSFERELRVARTGQNGAYIIESAQDYDLTFYSDVDGDDQTEKVRYYLQGSDLMRSIIEPIGFPVTYPPANAIAKPIAGNVVNDVVPLFFYYNSDWPLDTINNPMPTPADVSEIRLVQIIIRVNPNPENPRQEYVLDNFVQLRTIKDNL